MEIICAWCKKHMGSKEPLEDKSISHTICRECSIKFLGVDPETAKERMSNNPKRKRYQAHVETVPPKSEQKRIILIAETVKDAKDMLMKKYGKHIARILSLSEVRGSRKNPAVSERQRKFMCAELGRYRTGKRTRTGMKEKSLIDFCRKNPKYGSTSTTKALREEINKMDQLFMHNKKYTRNAGARAWLNKAEDLLGQFSPGSDNWDTAVKLDSEGVVKLLEDGERIKKAVGKNPVTSGERSMWKTVIKETAEYLRKAGYDKDSAYVSIYNRLRGIPDELIRSSINEAYRIGKNRRKRRR